MTRKQEKISLEEITALVKKVSKWTQREYPIQDHYEGFVDGIFVTFSVGSAFKQGKSHFYQKILVSDMNARLILGCASSEHDAKVTELYNFVVARYEQQKTARQQAAIAGARQIIDS